MISSQLSCTNTTIIVIIIDLHVMCAKKAMYKSRRLLYRYCIYNALQVRYMTSYVRLYVERFNLDDANWEEAELCTGKVPYSAEFHVTFFSWEGVANKGRHGIKRGGCCDTSHDLENYPRNRRAANLLCNATSSLSCVA